MKCPQIAWSRDIKWNYATLFIHSFIHSTNKTHWTWQQDTGIGYNDMTEHGLCFQRAHSPGQRETYKQMIDHFLPKSPFSCSSCLQGKDKLSNIACGPFLTWVLVLCSFIFPQSLKSHIPTTSFHVLSGRHNHPHAQLSSLVKLFVSSRPPLYLASFNKSSLSF